MCFDVISPYSTQLCLLQALYTLSFLKSSFIFSLPGMVGCFPELSIWRKLKQARSHLFFSLRLWEAVLPSGANPKALLTCHSQSFWVQGSGGDCPECSQIWSPGSSLELDQQCLVFWMLLFLSPHAKPSLVWGCKACHSRAWGWVHTWTKLPLDLFRNKTPCC